MVMAAELITNTQVVQWLLGIAAFAAAIRGIVYLIASGWKGFNKARQVLSALAQIGSEDSWPNGSTNLPDAIKEIYRRQSETNEQAATNAALVQEHLDKHNSHLWQLETGTKERTESYDDDQLGDGTA